jgi:hypothetical protein
VKITDEQMIIELGVPGNKSYNSIQSDLSIGNSLIDVRVIYWIYDDHYDKKVISTSGISSHDLTKLELKIKEMYEFEKDHIITEYK